ncbi:hypothetical protein [Bradyrhizobium iriomotense]|uniref:hypothetical protein n=1 Tax=Bradyrhizobium iriomotense TaxID=441950 RepID=UPI001B89DA75|nr:hypothetical protein [Bradyrhizobium iriomotense]MBR0780823.1 hypothetical protein [Bradyrhizobium iriomotense]
MTIEAAVGGIRLAAVEARPDLAIISVRPHLQSLPKCKSHEADKDRKTDRREDPVRHLALPLIFKSASSYCKSPAPTQQRPSSAEADTHQRHSRRVPSCFRSPAASNLSVLCGLLWGWIATIGISVMTENTQHHATRRNHLLEVALEEMIKFERRENEFRKKDREERAAELRLPLDAIKVH